ncbi:MAG: hypothetical protein ABSG88_12395 [Bradyrhizobium sp.]
MADEAFALSPIAARPVQPGEADYDAIKEAFMETSRGRWFLGEYAKRNRNADTKMVLDAVSRIEDTITASKKPVRDPLLDEALASLRTVLGQAREAANVALGDLALEQNLAPVRKGARVIREIAWRLREIGADGRICDLIDSQVAAIEGAAAKLAPSDLAGALSGAFDRIEEKIAGFDVDGAAASVAVHVEEPDEAGTLMRASNVAPEVKVEATAANPAASDESPMGVAPEAASEPADTFDDNDEAMLDMVAMEMSAPDTDAAYEPPMEEMSDDEMSEHQPPLAETPSAPAPAAQASVAAKNPHVPMDDIEITFVTDAREPKAEPAAVATAGAPIQVSPEAESAPSLGSSLLANGIVSRPRASRPDPLAPIRRMSQNEKIAFFS